MSTTAAPSTSTTSPLPRAGLARASRKQSPLEAMLWNRDIDVRQSDAGNRYTRDFLTSQGHVRTSDPSRPFVTASRNTYADDGASKAFGAWDEARKALDDSPTVKQQFSMQQNSDVLKLFLVDELPWSILCRSLVKPISDKTAKTRIVRLISAVADHYDIAARAKARSQDNND